MGMIRLAIIHWLLLASLARATQPVAVIDQGTAVSLPSGGGVFLSAAKSVGEGPKLWHVNSIVGFLASDGFPLVGPRDGTYTVELLVLGMVDGKPASSSAYCVVTIGGQPGPNPPPDPPKPPPGPTPVLPDGKFKLAAVAYNAGMTVPQPARGKAPALAAAFGATADAIGKGRFVDKASAGAWNKEQVAAALGSDVAAWQTAKDSIVNAVATLEKQTLSLPDFGIAMSEIGQGLLQVK